MKKNKIRQQWADEVEAHRKTKQTLLDNQQFAANILEAKNQEIQRLNALLAAEDMYGTIARVIQALPEGVEHRVIRFHDETIVEKVEPAAKPTCYHDWFEGNACAKCGVLRK